MHQQIRSDYLGNRSEQEVEQVINEYQKYCDAQKKKFDSLGTWQGFLVHSIIGNRDLSTNSNTDENK